VSGYGLRGDNQTNPQSQIEGFCPLSSVLSHLTSVTGYELLVADTNYFNNIGVLVDNCKQ